MKNFDPYTAFIGIAIGINVSCAAFNVYMFLQALRACP